MDQCSITSVIIHAKLAVLGSARFLPEALRAAHIQTGTGLTQSNVLGKACVGEGGLRQQVELLLSGDRQVGSFFETPPIIELTETL